MKDDKVCATSEAVIAAARSLFARFGPAKTSIEEIAREAGFSKATVYNYFSGKEEVVAAVIERERLTVVARLRRAAEEAEDPVQSLRAFFMARLREIQRHQDDFSAVREDLHPHMPKVLKAIEESRLEERKIIERILREGVEKGMFRPFKDIHLAADILFTTTVGYTFPFMVKHSARSMMKRFEGMVELLLAGVCTDAYRAKVLKEVFRKRGDRR